MKTQTPNLENMTPGEIVSHAKRQRLSIRKRILSQAITIYFHDLCAREILEDELFQTEEFLRDRNL